MESITVRVDEKRKFFCLQIKSRWSLKKIIIFIIIIIFVVVIIIIITIIIIIIIIIVIIIIIPKIPNSTVTAKLANALPSFDTHST